ncbi:MAG: hypothetical protein KDC84_12970 [Crocinitomicaceae bacterium]|nr:hypothetical protein [Crocinitomicaceae bacterium]
MKNKLLIAFTLLLFSFSSSLEAKDIQLIAPDLVFQHTEVEVKTVGMAEGDSIEINGNYYKVEKGQITYKFDGKALESKSHHIIMEAKPKEVPLWFSILPPLIAILLALVFKEVIFSLLTGIFVGTAIIGFYANGFPGIFSGLFAIIDTYLVNSLANKDHISVILFSMLIGAIVAVISRNGGMQGVVNKIIRFSKTRKSGQLSAYWLGVGIFFDDYANTLVVGNTMKTITDKLKISREKLAYIVDSTAAPISAIAFVTTWIGAELGYINSGMELINKNETQIQEGVYSVFLNSLAYSFYPILTLIFIYMLIRMKRDFGPMHHYEMLAVQGKAVDESDDTETSDTELKALQPFEGVIPKWFNAVVPILVVIFGTLIGLLFTGFEGTSGALAEINIEAKSWGDVWANMPSLEAQPTTFFQRLGTVIGNANSYVALLWSSLLGLIVAIGMTLAQRKLGLLKTMETVMTGFKTMMNAIVILVLAWALADLTAEMHTADFIKDLFGNDFAPWAIPAITFILSAIIAFSTGSSWSTMALVYPVMLPAAWAVASSAGYDYSDSMGIFYNTVSSVLAGAVLGDHCSPISDTTILSSLSCSCNHVNHVRTQMPYALTVGGVALVFGIIPAGLGVPFFITVPISVAAMWAIIRYFGKKVEEV